MKTLKESYVKEFADGSKIDSYSACGCFEGFEPREDVLDNIRAASFIAGTGLWRSLDRKSTRLNSSHSGESRMPSSA